MFWLTYILFLTSGKAPCYNLVFGGVGNFQSYHNAGCVQLRFGYIAIYFLQDTDASDYTIITGGSWIKQRNKHIWFRVWYISDCSFCVCVFSSFPLWD